MDTDEILTVFDRVTMAILDAFRGDNDRGLSGLRQTQYTHDVAADAVGVAMLVEAGFGVFSEESGLHFGDRDIVVVMDPIDGSTNASLGVPWFAASLCATQAGVPIAASVVNLASGDRFVAERGRGARRNGEPISVRATTELGSGVVGLSGYPTEHGGWEQFRVFGACALDMAMVAAGVLDGFADADDAHGAWDYLAAMLIVEESGGCVEDAFGRDLVVFDPQARRAPVAACTPTLLAELIGARRGWGGPSSSA